MTTTTIRKLSCDRATRHGAVRGRVKSKESEMKRDRNAADKSRKHAAEISSQRPSAQAPVSIKIFHREKWPGAVEASSIPSPAEHRRICLDKSVVICACVTRAIIEMRNFARVTQICLYAFQTQFSL
jgi:hypothetical protein